MSQNNIDVLIVGAGPVGLFCANELLRHGLSCRIIDKKSTTSDKSKALGIHIRTLDVLDDGGLIDEFIMYTNGRILGCDPGKTAVAELEYKPEYKLELPRDIYISNFICIWVGCRS